jgi:transcriptional regulator with XRE-family HTH domain
MTSAQMRAARAMLDWSQTKLAAASGVSVETIKRLERMDGAIESTKVGTLEAIKRALNNAGIDFTNGDEPGLKMRAKKKR